MSSSRLVKSIRKIELIIDHVYLAQLKRALRLLKEHRQYLNVLTVKIRAHCVEKTDALQDGVKDLVRADVAERTSVTVSNWDPDLRQLDLEDVRRLWWKEDLKGVRILGWDGGNLTLDIK